jgi:1,4-alpha-glucan branching enzyme
MNLTASLSRPKAARSNLHPDGRRVVGFELRQPRARSVSLLGIVGDWHPSFVKFEDHGHGLWTAKIELAPSDYSYRLIVDGSWSDAPAAVRTDASSQSIATRFFSIPRIAAAEPEHRQDAAPESSPSNDFLASDKSAHQRGFIHRANHRN